ncbi:MAG: bifunctional tRNA (5-methylaminomethyl-2-thiouridine)(34)-methyltransferase MnmD/FAD-dependent 5-carboxymethylaminomethyl-2-thiouridine(34) oxidoreductase MnmC [Robiginitomaculum sp.]|nr:bifunctional tRNA (5-methylaminomethyl-2-thiouridine)(34)-methyltransferase MnmD/FAD-dependent 5-carboxymethylaminomethyl-2-thiouridine(34) oxidoreductase MnmC [Robiginitomaculum sp.]
MSDLFLGLPVPHLSWSKDGVPHNLDYADGYFSDHDGLAETCTVFLKGCHLPDIWQDKARFTIAELGFGTGLNFLQTWDLWRKTRSDGARLHFISIEGAPFNRDDLGRAHGAFAPLQELAEKLRTRWPDPIKGVHRLFFDEDGLTLTLYFMDVDEALPQMESPADSWFLDGFAPSRNAAMWSEEVFTHLARLSRPGTRAATFSVAGSVRRGLQKAGFAVTKEAGHGRKRERLEAAFEGTPPPPLRRPSRPHAPGNREAKSVLVIGGGIAGASISHAFLRRGLSVTMICKAGPGDEASGNPAALVSPRLDLEDTPQARFFRTAFHHAAKTYQSLGDQIWIPCGLIRRPAHPSDVQKFSRLVAARALPETALCADKGGPGISLPGAGMVLPKPAIAALSDSAQIIKAQISSVRQKNGRWTAWGQQNQPIASADIAVLALGSGTLGPVSWLSFQYLKGQVSQGMLDAPYGGPALLAESYALGLDNGSLVFGATFDEIEHPDGALHPTAKDQERNLTSLNTLSPTLYGHLKKNQVTSRVSVRATTPDQMPYAGPLIDVDDFLQRFGAYRHGFLDPKVGKAQTLDNLFVLMGLGSRGFALAPILGEAIAAEALGEPTPLERLAAQAMHPARVLERRLKASDQK